MRIVNLATQTVQLFLCCLVGPTVASAANTSRGQEVVKLWPGQAPGTADWNGPEQGADVTLPNVGRIHVITNVRVPTVTVFRPTRVKANGTAMIILPGGSFRALAWDVDGIETAHWLTSRGVTAFVLKYRVRPPQKGESFGQSLDDFAQATQSRRAIAVADAERAVRLVRSMAGRYAISANRVGMIGFSAGAMATMDVILSKDRGARPDFAVVMYGAALGHEAPEADSPPLFIGAAQDDPELPATNSVQIFQRWTTAGRPAELHIYEQGGHGFGFRQHGVPADAWPASLQSWLSSHGFLRTEVESPRR